MADGIANDAVDARAARESVGAVEMLQVVQGNLAVGGGDGDRSVGQGTSLAQGEYAGGEACFTHGNGDEIPGDARQPQKPDAVADAARFGRDLYGIDAAAGWRIYSSRQIRRALKVVDRKQDTRRHGIFADGLAGKFAQGFDFEIAPPAAGFAGLRKPVEFAVHAPRKLASAFTAAACGEKCGVARPALALA